MYKIGVFGGTTEGRRLAEFLAKHQIPSVIFVTSEYGKNLLTQTPYQLCISRPVKAEEMKDLFTHYGFCQVIDATHPYASKVTPAIREACDQTGIPYVRCVRESQAFEEQPVTTVGSSLEAAAYLERTKGNILLTTGSKELEIYCGLTDYEKRLFVRVLADPKVIADCHEKGISGSHLMGMQGPFSREMNEAILKQWNISYLVTKEAGSAGGFMEKLQAAWECQTEVIVIGRPQKEEGETLEQILKNLKAQFGIHKTIEISLVGVGPGRKSLMTVEAMNVLSGAEVIFGASRLFDGLREELSRKTTIPLYLPKDVQSWLSAHPEVEEAVVLCSGDTGFYSNAAKAVEEFENAGYQCTLVPGISSVSYFCSRLGIPWQDIYLSSLHGRDQDVIFLLENYKKVLFLLGGENPVKALSNRLIEAGFGNVWLTVGERLSYEDEAITSGMAKDMAERNFDPLSLVLLQKETR